MKNSENGVAIIVDSAATVPPRFRDSAHTFTVPMLIHVGSQTYRDGVDLAPADFYAMQRIHAGQTGTSAPTPGDFLAAFERASEAADSILCVTVSSAFSASSAAAKTARSRLRAARPGLDVRILDSRTAVGAQGLIAWEAFKAAEAGADADAVEQAAMHVRQRVRLLAYVDTLRYLWKGGRVPGVAHLAASVLKLKPIFELRQSGVVQVARPRTSAVAVARLVELMRDRAGDGASAPLHVAVMHAEAPRHASDLATRIEAEFHCAELFESEFTPVMGAHIGPGMVGAAFWS